MASNGPHEEGIKAEESHNPDQDADETAAVEDVAESQEHPKKGPSADELAVQKMIDWLTAAKAFQNIADQRSPTPDYRLPSVDEPILQDKEKEITSENSVLHTIRRTATVFGIMAISAIAASYTSIPKKLVNDLIAENTGHSLAIEIATKMGIPQKTTAPAPSITPGTTTSTAPTAKPSEKILINYMSDDEWIEFIKKDPQSIADNFERIRTFDKAEFIFRQTLESQPWTFFNNAEKFSKYMNFEKMVLAWYKKTDSWRLHKSDYKVFFNKYTQKLLIDEIANDVKSDELYYSEQLLGSAPVFIGDKTGESLIRIAASKIPARAIGIYSEYRSHPEAEEILEQACLSLLKGEGKKYELPRGMTERDYAFKALIEYHEMGLFSGRGIFFDQLLKELDLVVNWEHPNQLSKEIHHFMKTFDLFKSRAWQDKYDEICISEKKLYKEEKLKLDYSLKNEGSCDVREKPAIIRDDEPKGLKSKQSAKHKKRPAAESPDSDE